MKILEESSFEAEDSYGVIYQEGKKQKIVTVNRLNDIDWGDDSGKDLEIPTNYGVLELRTFDFYVCIERLFFYEGIFSGHEDEYEFKPRKIMRNAEAYLVCFAREFKFAFETNPKLKKYLPTVFKDLVRYLDIDKL
jgi:hypothetical protein